MDRPRYTFRGWIKYVLMASFQNARMALWRRRNRKIVRILENVIGEKACRALDATPVNPGIDNYDTGWDSCASILRGRLRRHGYLPNSAICAKPASGAAS